MLLLCISNIKRWQSNYICRFRDESWAFENQTRNLIISCIWTPAQIRAGFVFFWDSYPLFKKHDTKKTTKDKPYKDRDSTIHLQSILLVLYLFFKNISLMPNLSSNMIPFFYSQTLTRFVFSWYVSLYLKTLMWSLLRLSFHSKLSRQGLSP